MSLSTLTLRLDFRTYWLHARGEGGGADFDLVMDTDDDGLPVLRGRHATGLLRLALLRAQVWGWFADLPEAASDDDIPVLLLGRLGADEPGCLDVRTARVPYRLRDRLLADRAATAACFRRISSTAIEPLSGTAAERQLRSVEAAIPLPLELNLAFLPATRRLWAGDDAGERARIETAARCWQDWLALAWPAFDEAGAKRTRGFGRLAYTEALQDPRPAA